MAKFFPSTAYKVGVNAPAEYPDSSLTAYGAALRAATKYDPSLNKIPITSIIANILQERKPNNYGVDPVQLDPHSRDDRNTASMLNKLYQEPGLDPNAVQAVATLSTKNQIATRKGQNVFQVWNGGGNPNHAQAVQQIQDSLDANPVHKQSVLTPFMAGYSQSIGPDNSPQSDTSDWMDKMQRVVRDYTGGW